MTTGLQFANIEPKKLLGNQDLRERFLTYLRDYVAINSKYAWAKGGIFGAVKWTLTGISTNTVRVTSPVTSTTAGTDGLGHILDLSVTGAGNLSIGQIRDFPIENSNTSTYYISYSYTFIPKGITINPRNGLPQFSYFVDAIGRKGNPDAVTDNGNGTLTFNINTICDGSGHSYAGRTVIVYKTIPERNSNLESIAIESKTITWNGSLNRITTTAVFGQSAISLNATDYTVILLGPYVTKTGVNSNTIGQMFVGAVTGNGGTPGTGDVSQQNLIDQSLASLAASNYSGGGIWADGTTNPSTTVGLQLTKIVTDLGSTTGKGGAGKLGASAFTPWLDGTLNSAPILRDAIDKIITDLSATSGAKKVGAQLPSAWADGTTNAAGSVHSVLDGIVSKLGSKLTPDGAAKIGTLTGPLSRLTGGSVRSQLNQLEAGAGLGTNLLGQSLDTVSIAPGSPYGLSSGDVITYVSGKYVNGPTAGFIGLGTGTANDVVIPNIESLTSVYVSYSGASVNLAGIQAPAGARPGFTLFLINTNTGGTPGTSGVNIKHYATTSLAANRFVINGGVDLFLNSSKFVMIVYGGTFWSVITSA